MPEAWIGPALVCLNAPLVLVLCWGFTRNATPVQRAWINLGYVVAAIAAYSVLFWLGIMAWEQKLPDYIQSSPLFWLIAYLGTIAMFFLALAVPLFAGLLIWRTVVLIITLVRARKQKRPAIASRAS